MSEYRRELLTPITAASAITRMLGGEVLYATLLPNSWESKWVRAFRIMGRLQIQDSDPDNHSWENYHCAFNTVMDFEWFDLRS
jgi:hypothetical protein